MSDKITAIGKAWRLGVAGMEKGKILAGVCNDLTVVGDANPWLDDAENVARLFAASQEMHAALVLCVEALQARKVAMVITSLEAEALEAAKAALKKVEVRE